LLRLIRNYFVSFVSWVFPAQLFLALFLAFVTRWRLAHSAVHGIWEKFRFDRNSYSMILCCIIKQDQQTTAALLAVPLMTYDPRISKLSDSDVYVYWKYIARKYQSSFFVMCVRSEND